MSDSLRFRKPGPWDASRYLNIDRQMASLSIVIPAFNEALYIGDTLERLTVAAGFVKASGADVEVIVVDNASTDRTAALAAGAGARVIHESEHNIARVRNSGAAMAAHDVLVFLDADIRVPPELLARISQTMADPRCAGGAVDMRHHARRLTVRAYLGAWRFLGLLGGMAQGACQFCRRSVLHELGGYDETQYMGEDVDFFWRLRRLARRRGLSTSYIRDLPVLPSPRRFDRWPLWRILVWTNPVVALALRRRKAMWAGWYERPPR
jgi:glycosyltransferase involved in cell wall biosynthesis